MPELIGGFTTRDGERLLKKRDTNGETYYVRKGDGIVSESTYNGHLSRFETAVTGDNGKVLPDLRDATSLNELREKTRIPFDRVDGPIPTRVPEDAPEHIRGEIAELRRFKGFIENRDYDTENRDDRLRAAKDYLEFRSKMADADTDAIRRQIRNRYLQSSY